MERKAFSGIVLTLLLISMLTLAFNIQPVEASRTIYIRADGSVDPPTANITSPDNVTYYFTGNNYDSILVQRDNIVVDGAGYTLQGTGSGKGVDLTGRSNVTIKNMEIKQFVFGIYLNHSSSNSIIENDFISITFECIRLYESSNNTIAANNLILNDIDGITLYGSSNNNITKNYLMSNYDGIRLYESSNNSITENIVIENYYGIFLASSSDNNIVNNNVTANHGTGISLYWSSNENRISGNKITNNDWNGIHLKYNSNYNAISSNTILNNRNGINIEANSNNNYMLNNYIADSEWDGIDLKGSHSNNIKGNTITNCFTGIYLGSETDNMNIIYHNNLINNMYQVTCYSTPNMWDYGYPSGGNYWSDYEERYPDAQELDGSGIWDTPYIIDGNNQDNYPLMEPWGLKPPSPAEATRELIETIETWNLSKGVETSLTSKLDNVIHMFDKGNEKGATHKLIVLANQVEALRGKKLTTEQANHLIAEAQKIINLIEG